MKAGEILGVLVGVLLALWLAGWAVHLIRTVLHHLISLAVLVLIIGAVMHLLNRTRV